MTAVADYPRNWAWAAARWAVAPPAQGLVEYGLILALTAVLTVTILTVFGGVLAEVLDLIADAIEQST